MITKNLVMARLGLKAIRRYPLAALAEKRVPDPVKIVVKRYGGYGPAWDRFDQDRPRGKMN